jgi:arylsulfatase A-like enzyme
VTVTVRGENVTQQPIPRSLDEGDLLVSARDADWIYIRNTETGTEELYDRRSDPEQRTDLSAADDGTAVAARERLREAVSDHATLLDGVDRDVSAAGVDEDIETRLEALGYR